MKPISFVGCLLFAGACNAPAPATIDATKASVDELRAAVPTRAALTIAPAATQKLDAPSACAGLGPSSFGTLTHQIAGNADGVVGGVAGIVDDITKSPPAAAAPGHAVWGPIPSPSGDVVYRLEVTGAPPSEFHFVLAGKTAAADESAWRGIFQGVSVAADATHHAGQVAVDFDVMHALDASVDPLAGKVAVHFDSDGAARAVTAAFAGVQGKSAPQPDDAQYAFQMGADQFGRPRLHHARRLRRLGCARRAGAHRVALGADRRRRRAPRGLGRQPRRRRGQRRRMLGPHARPRLLRRFARPHGRRLRLLPVTLQRL